MSELQRAAQTLLWLALCAGAIAGDIWLWRMI